jgi:hypothetical protein
MHNAEKLYPSKTHRLAYFEEAAGILHEIMEQDDALIALIDQNRFTISLDLGQSLRPLIGQRITILRTDIQDKPYLFRVLAQNSEQSKQ